MFKKCSCNHCSGHIEFDASQAGQVVTCPHCGMETVLFVQQVPKPQTTKPPQNVGVEIKRGMNPFGIASLVLGIVACVFCWIPFLGLFAIPLACIGLLLAVVGITASIVGKKTNPPFPMGGAVVCIAAILIAVFVTGGISTLIAKGKQTNQEQVSNSGKNTSFSAAGVWSKSHIVKQGDVQVEIKRVSFPSDSPAIQIELSVENMSTTKKVDFAGWSAVKFDFDGSAASLTDNNQNKYKLIVDGASSDNAIYPQQAASDTLKFETPVEKIQWLHLELPAKNIGGSGMLRFEFSINKIKAAMNELKQVQADFDSFKANRPFRTNADYVKIQDKITVLESLRETTKNRCEALFEKVRKAMDVSGYIRPEYSLAIVQGWNDEGFRLQDQYTKTIPSQLTPLYNQLTEIEQNAFSLYSSKVDLAQSRLNAVEQSLEASPR